MTSPVAWEVSRLGECGVITSYDRHAPPEIRELRCGLLTVWALQSGEFICPMHIKEYKLPVMGTQL